MGNLLRLLGLTSLVAATISGVNHGYNLLVSELSGMVQQTYGAVGVQLEQNANCQNSTACAHWQETGQSLQEVNAEFQQTIKSSSSH